MIDLSKIRIILVETGGALNLGSVARVMKNMGLSNLVLVNPQCDRNSDEAQHMAVHGKEVLDKAQIVPDLPTALTGCSRAIATTSEPRSLSTPLEPLRTTLPWLGETNQPTALIFGREDRGLSNIELSYAQKFVAIPAHGDYPSLNLAQAVAICCYELYQLSLESLSYQDSQDSQDSQYSRSPLSLSPVASAMISQTPAEKSLDRTTLVSLDALEMYYQQLETILLKIGYLYPHTAPAKMIKFRHLFNRVNLAPEELAMMRGVLSQVEWAVRQKV
ncbi:MAG: RNA methyltransferase [Coleofasciculaceae cyanobacterium SM2_1_6]|nr:RNA methyltransferase [Coleofasciculaceae cyanobacterium SM2_1_6]